MNITSTKEYTVLPRPAEKLPEYAHAKARQTLAEKLQEAFGLSAAAATAISNAVVDPAAVRKSINDTADPTVESIAVPGGTLLGIRTAVWARRIMPDARNPRTLPSRRHPFAVEPGKGAEDSKFRPVPEPRTPSGVGAEVAELAVQIESREHLHWASQQAAGYVLANNNWKDSIASQGVMESVYLVAMTYNHDDGIEPVTTLTTVDGSSRVTATHEILGIRSSDVPYDDQDTKFRGHIRKLNEEYERGADKQTLDTLRCERIPALILVGFVPYHSGTTGFPTAVKSIVALRHVDPPTPWGEGPENESLADEVLDELHRRSLITSIQHAYYAGSCTRAEARAAHLSDDPAIRAAEIVGLLTNPDQRFRTAIRVAVTSQSTRKRIGTKLLNDLATALVLRAVAGDPSKADQVRRYLRFAFGKSVHSQVWQSTSRDTDTLVRAALSEVHQSIANGSVDERGPASLELAVRAAYPLVVSGRLNADRGSANNDQPDRRTPGEVLDAMRQNVQGVHQLGQALRDFAEGRHIRAVAEDGSIKVQGDAGDQMVNDIYLRGEFPPAGKARARRPGDTPTDRYHNAVSAMANAITALTEAFDNLRSVEGDDGRALVETKGVDQRACAAWREELTQIDDELVLWSVTHRRANGANADARRLVEEAKSLDDEPIMDVTDEWELEGDEPISQSAD
ncbi:MULTISPECIES: hypothetical protein [unclassified Mesorhizobium]|uniref:hypothetical protein n=1 Tax=unclassified Mesorhizobium TaxID=325217 RepID=UPI00333DCA67